MRHLHLATFLLCLALTGCDDQSTASGGATDAEYERQSKESARQLDVAGKQLERVVEAPMEVTPMVIEVGPVVSVTVSVTVAAAMEDRRRAKTTTAEHRPCTEAAAAESSAAAAETTAVKCRAAAAEAAAMKRRSATAEAAAMETAATTAAKTATAHPTATLYLDRQTVGCVFS